MMIGILPDTQFHSRYATEETGNPYMRTYGSEPFAEQTKWLASSQDNYGTEFVVHLGDVVDQADHLQQWDTADRAMSTLEDAYLPYSVLAGNHDVGNSYAEYQQYFPESRAAKQSNYGGSDPSGLHSYHIVNHGEQQVLVLSLSWGADQAAIDWAQNVLDAHPTTPTILASHQLINVASDGTTPVPTDFGETMWNSLIRKNDQVFLTLNGHHHGATKWERTNDYGHPVHQILIDHQMAYMGGNGILSMLDLDFTNNEISLTTLSPWVAVKPENTLQPLDDAYLDGENQTFTLPFNFTERFADLKVSADTRTSPTVALREWISAVEVPEAVAPVPAANDEDYPKVDGTLAHWRPNGPEGTAAVGSEIPDIAGGNTFTRAELNIAGAQGAEEEDVRFSSDHSPLSSNPGSVCFDNSNKQTKRASWFTTAADDPINTATMDNGFTMETFVKVDPSFNVDNNAWMTWLGRDGKRSEIPGYAGTEGDEPPMAWAFSTLNEVQFAFVDNTDAKTEASLWSGEIVNYTEWMHLAVTFDPESKLATLYVDGIPMLRDATGVEGLAHNAGMPWLLGAGTYAGERDSGFVGCIGETRIVEGVLTPDQWLTARAAAPVAEPTAEPTAPAETPEPTASAEPSAVPTVDPVESSEPSSVPTVKPSATPTAADGLKATPVAQATAARKTAAAEHAAPVARGRDSVSNGQGNATTPPSTVPAAQSHSALPRTGTDVAVLAAVGAAVMLAGAGTLTLRKPKR